MTTKNSPTTTPDQKKRLRAFRAMTPELQTLAKTMLKHLRDPNVSMAIKLHNLGQKARMIHQDEAGFGIRGEDLLATYLGIRGGSQRIWSLMKFAEAFDRDFVEEIVQSPAGSHVTTDHWETIATLPDANLRSEMLRLTIEQGLSVKELHRNIKMIGKPVPTQTRRRPRMPSSPIATLHKYQDLVGRVVRKAPDFVRHFHDQFLRIPADGINETLKASLEKSRSVLIKGREVLQEHEARLDALLRRVNEVLEKRKRKSDSGLTG